MAERLPPGVYDRENTKLAYLPNGLDLNGDQYSDGVGEWHSRFDSISSYYLASSTGNSVVVNGTQALNYSPRDTHETNEINLQQSLEHLASNGTLDHPDIGLPTGGQQVDNISVAETLDHKDSGPFSDGGNGTRSRTSTLITDGSQVEAEWIEQYEPGVYITLVSLRDGTRDLKRVRFRYDYYFDGRSSFMSCQ